MRFESAHVSLYCLAALNENASAVVLFERHTWQYKTLLFQGTHEPEHSSYRLVYRTPGAVGFKMDWPQLWNEVAKAQ